MQVIGKLHNNYNIQLQGKQNRDGLNFTLYHHDT
jgi:hypothetical protein